MGMYGSGISFAEACNFDKMRIKAALEGFELDIDTGEKYPIGDEQAREIILNAYDEAVYQGLTAMRSGKALESIAEKNGYVPEKYLKEYNAALASINPDTEYKYETDIIEED